MGCLYRAPLAAPIGAKRLPYGAPLPPEAPYQIHQPQNKSGYKITVAVQLLAHHLEVNCQYKMFA